jgi:hypothetical protein
LKRPHPQLRDIMACIEGHAPYNKWCWLLTLRKVTRMPSLKLMEIGVVIATQGISAEYEGLLFPNTPASTGAEVVMWCK